MNDQTYHPIDCSLHDRLEALAVTGREVRLRFSVEDGVQEISDRLADVFARSGAEYLRTAGGVEVRLDRLLEVDGVPYRGAEC